MRLIMTLVFLAFPIAEIWILIYLFLQYGAWLLLYLVATVLLGLQLIRDEKRLLSDKMMRNLSQGDSPIKVLFGSARNIIAGILLIIPGVITDLIAVVLLLMPVSKGATKSATFKQEASHENVIEGEFRREE